MSKIPHGEPYAGKLHVRFDEGADVPCGGVPLYSTPSGAHSPSWARELKPVICFVVTCVRESRPSWALKQFGLEERHHSLSSRPSRARELKPDSSQRRYRGASA